MTVARGEVNLRSELQGQFFNSTLRNKDTGEETKSQFLGLTQRNNLYVSKTLYPYLSVRGGGIFEFLLSESQSLGATTESSETRLKPFGEITLDNPVYKAGFWYSRTILDERLSGAPDGEATLEEWRAFLGWKPSDVLEVNGRYSQSHAQEDPSGADLLEKRIVADLNYLPLREIQVNYLFTNKWTDDLRQGSSFTEQTHNGRVEFSRAFFGNHVLVNTSYNLQYLSLDLPAEGSQDRLLPVPRVAGLSAIDNTPATGPVADPAPGLIDGNLVAPTGIDLGLDGDEFSQTNVAVDLGTETKVDTVFLWVDRSLSSPVANAFTWSVYASPDNDVASTWTLVTTVVNAEFGPFDNRFVIPFPETETRFLKVVTRPLTVSVPDAASFPNIFVTELEVFQSVPEELGNIRQEDLAHNYAFNVRAHLSDKTNCGYNLFFQDRRRSFPDETRRELSHGVYLAHRFNEMFSVNANATRIDVDEEDGETVNYRYSTSLKASYLATFSQSLVFSGFIDREDIGTRVRHSIFLRNNADLYEGWTVYLDAGYLWETGTGAYEDRTNLILRAGSEIFPDDKVSITLNYSGLIDLDPSQLGSLNRNRLDLQAFVLPTRTLSLFGRISVVDEEGPVQILQNYSVNWSPFPDGDLQFLFTYTEAMGTGVVTGERSFGPAVKWKIGLHAYFDFYYYRIRTENQTQLTNSDSVTAKVRIQF